MVTVIVRYDNKCSEKIMEDLMRVALTTEHKDMAEAVMADIIDAIPVIGDLTNAAKALDAVKKDEPLVAVAQAIDFLGGLIPVLGDIFDIVTPTNTVLYMLKRR